MSTLSNQNTNNHPYCYSDRQGCRVVIEVMDNGRSGIGRAGILAIAVPYDRFSQTLRSIKRSGRKICNIFISQLQLPDQQADVIAETTATTVESLTSATSSESSEVASDAESTDIKAMDCIEAPANAALPLNAEVLLEQPVEPTIEPVIEPTIEPVIEPTIEPIIEPTIEPVEPVIEPTIEPVIEPTIEPVEPVIEPTIEPVEPVIELVEPVIEPTIALKSELVANVEVAPTANAKKPKASTKTAASGFNKRKNAQTTTKSPRKPKS